MKRLPSNVSGPESHWLTFDLFQGIRGLNHGAFLRFAGDGVGPIDSLDLIARQRFGAHRLYWAKQCHGTSIIDVTTQSEVGQVADALITAEPGIALLIQHADCQAALFYDPIQHVIAAVHAGWRGSVQNIYAKVIDRLCNSYHCKPENLLVGIGPSLGPKHAEFIHYRTELPPAFWEFQPTPNYFDFWAISDAQLRAAGVLPHHIEIAEICTYANVNDCFSYRRDKTTRRHGTLISLAGI